MASLVDYELLTNDVFSLQGPCAMHVLGRCKIQEPAFPSKRFPLIS